MKRKKTKVVFNRIMIGAGLAVAAIFIALGIIACLPEDSINYCFAENMGKWQVSEGSGFRQIGDTVKFTKGNNQLYVIIPQINVDADYYDVCVIEGSWPIAYDQGHLLFISSFNQQFDFNFRYDFDTGRAGTINKRYVDLSSHGAWQGMVGEVLILPATDAKQVFLKEIRFIHANPWTKIKAIWGQFTRYSDPKLGSCFAMASPFFIKTSFNLFFLPFLGWLLVICLVVSGFVSFLKLDDRIRKYISLAFFLAFLLIWGLLEARNEVYCLKGIGRDISLYWGKPLQEKRGIVTGDPDFVKFMAYCDEHIPLEGRVFNLISSSPPGTPQMYLRGTQFAFQLRPRLNSVYQFSDIIPKTYYLVYQMNQEELKTTGSDQWVVDRFINLASGDQLRQRIVLWDKLENLSTVKLKLKEGEQITKDDLSVLILDETGRNILARGLLTGVITYEAPGFKKYAEPAFRIVQSLPYEKGRVIMQVLNNRGKSVDVGYSSRVNPFTGFNQGRNEGLLFNGQAMKGELAFTSEYQLKHPKIFKQYSDKAYILTSQ